MTSIERLAAIIAEVLPLEKIRESMEKLHNNFTYHAPTTEAKKKFAALRTHFCGVAAAVDVACPNSREKSLALTKIEEAMMWANAAIARNECPPEAPSQGSTDGAEAAVRSEP